jgi:hypothetical protein
MLSWPHRACPRRFLGSCVAAYPNLNVRAFSLDGEQVLLQGNIQRLRVYPSGKEIDVDLLFGSPDIDRGKGVRCQRADAGRRRRPVPEHPVHLTARALELVEDVVIETG